MPSHHIDVIIPCGKTNQRPIKIRPVIPISGLSNVVIQATNNLGDTNPQWVTAQNNHKVGTPNFLKDTSQWEVGLHITADADSADAYLGEPACYLELGAAYPDFSIVSWADGTDDEIAAMINGAHAGIIDLQTDCGWQVGDERIIHTATFIAGGNVTVTEQDNKIAITSFDDYMSCGCKLQFDFVTVFNNFVRMHSSSTNVGGYGITEMYTVTMPRFANAMPTWIKNLLIPFDCLSTAGNRSTTLLTVENNLLAPRAACEVATNYSTYAFSGEGTFMPYYQAKGAKKKRGLTNNFAKWNTRSPQSGSNNTWVGVDTSGRASNSTITESTGVSPFGCI